MQLPLIGLMLIEKIELKITLLFVEHQDPSAKYKDGKSFELILSRHRT